MARPAEPTGSSMIFATPKDRAVKVWLDPHLPIRAELAVLLQTHGASISPDHADPHTPVLVLHPSSTTVFDQYCHPAWLSMAGIFRHIKRKRSGEVEGCGQKVIVTERWPTACLTAGRYLGEEDDWGGCRKGGPAKRVVPVINLPVDPPRSIHVERAPPAPVSPHPAPLAPQPAASAVPDPLAIPPSGPRKIAGLPARATLRLPNATPPRAAPPLATSRFTAREPTRPDRQPDPDASAAATPRAKNAASQGKTKGVGVGIARGVGYTPITTATSKWQLAQEPPKIFGGLRFYLDGGRNGRKHTMANIQKSSGQIVPEPSRATHCVLSQVYSGNVEERRKLIASATAKGAWCLTYEWLEGSWDAGRRLDEADYVYEGGTPHGVELEEGEVYQPPSAAKVATAKQVPTVKQVPSQYALPRELPFPLDELDKILRRTHPISLMPGKKPSDVWKHLFDTYPERMSKYSWRAIYHSWLECTGPFSSASEDTDYTRYLFGLKLKLPLIQAGHSITEVAEILANRYPYFPLTASEWEVHLGNWLRTLPPDTPDHATPALIREKRRQEESAKR